MTMNDSNRSGTSFVQLSKQDFMALGLHDVAYIKLALDDGKKVFAIHTADGRFAGAAETRENADATVRQNDLEPVSVH